MPGSLGWGPGVETWYPSEALIPWAKHPTFHMWLIAIQVTPVFGGNHVSQEKKVYKIKKSLFEIWPSKLDVALVIKCNLPIGLRGTSAFYHFTPLKKSSGTSLLVRRLRLRPPTQAVRVRSLVKELRNPHVLWPQN